MQCPDLSGTYNFFGKPARAAMADEATELRFDEKAMAMTVRTVIEPHTVVLNHNVSSGTLTVDVLGKGSDPRSALMSAKLPLTATYLCEAGRWVREKVMVGGAGGGRPSETREKISLSILPTGLHAVGISTSEVGTFSRRTFTQEWDIVFDRKLSPRP